MQPFMHSMVLSWGYVLNRSVDLRLISFSRFCEGDFDNIIAMPKKAYAFVNFCSIRAAVHARAALDGYRMPGQLINITPVKI